jgi:acylphosphatase
LIAARHYLIRGRVQGVGYRYFAREAADRWNVHGYARNLASGDVEIHAEAEESLLNAFRQELERGPHAARVSEVIERELPVTQTYTSFLIRG